MGECWGWGPEEEGISGPCLPSAAMEAWMYRSVRESNQSGDEGRNRLYRVEGILVGLVVFVGLFYLLGWVKI